MCLRTSYQISIVWQRATWLQLRLEILVYNRKGWYSILVQAVVDHDYLFTDLYIGWPGSVHDARVLANSGIYQKANNKEILQGNSMLVNDQDIPIFLVGGSAYPLLPCLIKPFAMTSSLTEQQKFLTTGYAEDVLWWR